MQIAGFESGSHRANTGPLWATQLTPKLSQKLFALTKGPHYIRRSQSLFPYAKQVYPKRVPCRVPWNSIAKFQRAGRYLFD